MWIFFKKTLEYSFQDCIWFFGTSVFTNLAYNWQIVTWVKILFQERYISDLRSPDVAGYNLSNIFARTRLV